MDANLIEQLIYEYLTWIYRDIAFLYTQTKLPDPKFKFVKRGFQTRKNWMHKFNEDGILEVRMYPDNLDKESIIRNSIHIFIHIYNKTLGVDDMVNSGPGYHKTPYMEMASKIGIQCEPPCKNYGYELPKKLPEQIVEEGMRVIDCYYSDLSAYLSLYRALIQPRFANKKETYVTYQCPVCKKAIIGIDNSHIICGTDNCEYEKV